MRVNKLTQSTSNRRFPTSGFLSVCPGFLRILAFFRQLFTGECWDTSTGRTTETDNRLTSIGGMANVEA
jgi:hypothetical protein